MINGNMKSRQTKKRGVKGLWKPLFLLLIVTAIIIIVKFTGISEKLNAIPGWIETLGVWGPVVFVGIYIAGVVAALPGSALTVAAGPLFGSVIGVILVSIASTTGACLSFLIGRYFARDAVSRWLSQKEKFQKLDRLTKEQGAIMVAITRLVPIFPFNLLNYGFGLTGVPFLTYVFWSWLCMLPGTVLYVVGADALWKSLTKGEIPWVLIGVVLGMFIFLSVVVRFARKKLQEKEKKTRTT
jgi:uncharacterized membrane protein YdjX (TVP38/TMEM64 family)